MSFFRILGELIKNEYYNIKYNSQVKVKTILLLVFIIILGLHYKLFIPFIIVMLIGAAATGIFLASVPERKEYNKSVYKIITRRSYFDIITDTGAIAEYLIWKELNNQNMHQKILINLYIPKQNGETTEIDIVLINKFGIYVIESKNYSGWIFGSEDSNKWMKMNWGRKCQFYSPINQNRNHILALANILKEDNMNMFKSYIIFSQRADIKKMKISKKNIKVINREKLIETLNEEYKTSPPMLSFEQINELERKLSKYMYPDERMKNQHNKNIKEKYKV